MKQFQDIYVNSHSSTPRQANLKAHTGIYAVHFSTVIVQHQDKLISRHKQIFIQWINTSKPILLFTKSVQDKLTYKSLFSTLRQATVQEFIQDFTNLCNTSSHTQATRKTSLVLSYSQFLHMNIQLNNIQSILHNKYPPVCARLAHIHKS